MTTIIKTKADINDATIIKASTATANGLSGQRKALYKAGMTVGAYREAVKKWAAKAEFVDPKTGKPLTGKDLEAKRKVQSTYGLLDVYWDFERGKLELVNK